MSAALRRVLALLLALAPVYTFASDWQQPTPEELNMKSYPAAPDAPALYLFCEETLDENIHTQTYYWRIKILTEKGKEIYGNIEIPYLASASKVEDLSGRTIHSDGTAIPFSGSPYNKLVVKEGGLRVMEKLISMPDVQVGSILELRFKVHSGYFSSPRWDVQQSIPVLKAHYYFLPSSLMLDGGEFKVAITEQGHQNLVDQLLYASVLPSGDKVVQLPHGGYELNVENVPALPQEDYSPPLRSLSYRVVFYYSPFANGSEYWRTEGKYWSKDFDRFANPTNKIRTAVNAIVAPGDNDQQKVSKIYSAVMKLENTSFTREHSANENKAEGLKVKTAEDIWAQQRGNSDEITRLFVAMVRAAGLKSYGAIVVNRNVNLFEQNYLTWRQLDDELAIVSIDGKEVFFDPGQRYCEFAKLHWKHTWAGGIRQTGSGTEVFSTPGPSYMDNSMNRNAQLTLDPDGQVHGLIEETMTGAEALRWRQAALREDEDAIKKEFEEELQKSVPPSVHVKTNHFVRLADCANPLTVVVNVSGTLGTETGKRIFLPSVFFEAGSPPLFAETQRKNAVYMHFPYMVQDQFQLALPQNVKIESLPKSGDLPFAQHADYASKFVSEGSTFAYGRLLRVASIIYKPAEYSSLRSFFQTVSSDDHEQVALTIAPAAAAVPVISSTKPAGGR